MRFDGEKGRLRLIELIADQKIIRHDMKIAEHFAEASKVIVCQKNDDLIVQGETDNDLFLILTGSFDVYVNGHRVALRVAGEEVGEMAAINPAAIRSATVRAREESIVAHITESDFLHIADQFPQLWRNFARETSSRLADESLRIRPRNPVPRLFISSPPEGVSIARNIQNTLAHDDIIVTISSDNIFDASSHAVNSFLDEAGQSDFCALVLTNDGPVINRGSMQSLDSDSIVFEIGLFMGTMGPNRIFLIMPRQSDINIPIELLGLKVFEYQVDPDKSPSSVLTPMSNLLRDQILSKGAL
jgi:predicted nucleotide-binding protein